MLYWSGMTKTANSESKKFLIKSQVSIEILADQLYDEGIISNKSDFLKVAAYKKLSTKRIAIGMYEIAPQTDLRSLLNGFTLNAAGNGNAEIEILERMRQHVNNNPQDKLVFSIAAGKNGYAKEDF